MPIVECRWTYHRPEHAREFSSDRRFSVGAATDVASRQSRWGRPAVVASVHKGKVSRCTEMIKLLA